MVHGLQQSSCDARRPSRRSSTLGCDRFDAVQVYRALRAGVTESAIAAPPVVVWGRAQITYVPVRVVAGLTDVVRLNSVARRVRPLPRMSAGRRSRFASLSVVRPRVPQGLSTAHGTLDLLASALRLTPLLEFYLADSTPSTDACLEVECMSLHEGFTTHCGLL